MSLKNFGLKEISVSKILLLKKVSVSVSKILDSKKVSVLVSEILVSKSLTISLVENSGLVTQAVVPKLMPLLRTVVLLGFMSCLPMLMPHL